MLEKSMWFMIFPYVQHAMRAYLGLPILWFCLFQGKVPFISYDGIHQLHIFIFVLAIFHVVCSLITLALGRAKVDIDLLLQLFAICSLVIFLLHSHR